MKSRACTSQHSLGLALILFAALVATGEAVVVKKDVADNSTSRSGALSACGARPASHICDPAHVLSADILREGTKELGALAALRQPQICKGQAGYETYVALLDMPESDARAAAVELGGHWGVLGTKCGNGVMVVYSTLDGVFSIVADKQLEDNALSHQLESFIASSSTGILPHSPDVVISSLVSHLAAALDGKLYSPQYVLPNIVHSGAEFLLYMTSIVLGVASSALLVCCMYDAGSHWRHRARFHSCQKKVQRVHEVFLSKKGEMPLCPCCVETVSSQPSPSEVVFLCGHRFHIDCTNRWFQQRPELAGKCPICECRPDVDTQKDEETGAVDEAKTFILSSLHQQYPEIVPAENVQRWASCHTEIWLSELSCPRYYSIFNKHK